jgi:elongation factor Tu
MRPERGQVLVTPGSIQAYTRFEAEIYMITREDGGVGQFLERGHRLQCYFRTTDVPGTIHLPVGVETVILGSNVTITAELDAPVAIEEGLRFALRNHGHTVGAGIVTRILG